MAKVIILCGKIASGKTTYAEKLKSENAAVILSYDSVLLSMFDGCLGAKHDETVGRISAFFYPLTEQIIALGMDVILDFGHWTKCERTDAKAYFAERNIMAELHYVVTDEQSRKERLEQRNRKVAGLKEPTYIIESGLREKLDKKFEEPTKEEIDYIFEVR